MDSTATPKLQPISNKHARRSKDAAATGEGDSNAGNGREDYYSSSYRGRNYDPNYQRNYHNYDSKNYYKDNFNNNRFHDRSQYDQDYKNCNKRNNPPDDQYRNSSRWYNFNYYRSGYNAYHNNTNFSQVPDTDLQESSAEKSPNPFLNKQFNVPVWVQAKAAKRALAEKTAYYSNDSLNDESIVDKKVPAEKSLSHSKDSLNKKPVALKKVFVVKEDREDKTVPTKNKLSATNLSDKPKTTCYKKSLNFEDTKLSVEKSASNSKNVANKLSKAGTKALAKKFLSNQKDVNTSKTGTKATVIKSPIPPKDSLNNIHKAIDKTIAVTNESNLEEPLSTKSIPFKVFVVKNCETLPNKKSKKQDKTPKTPSSKNVPKTSQKCPSPLQKTIEIVVAPENSVSISPSSSTDTVKGSFQISKEVHDETLVTPSLQTEVANSDSDSPKKIETKYPKISLIPLSRLIRNELLELTEDNLNSVVSSTTPTHSDIFNITPSKLICKPNLVRRRRNISSCSNSSNTTETIVEKVVNMDKMGIKNVINNSGTKYDEALKLQARKLLREEIRKQLKSMNVEEPKDSANVEFMPDDIVDAIHIPDVVLDEIRKAFGIDFIGAENMRKNSNEEQHFENQTNSISVHTISDANQSDEAHISQAESSITTNYVSGIIATTTHKSTNDLMSRLRIAEYIKSPVETSTQKELPQFRFADECSPMSLQVSDRMQSITASKTHDNSLLKESCKKKKFSSRRRRSSEVIVILSSSSSSNSSSSSSSSSSSDTDSDTSTHSAASSVKRRRQKQKVDSENVVDSFEKLILPSISENLAKRYNAKYSNSISTKLHFISCICVSGYNSEKFSKIEIAKIQRNLKSNDSSIALEFLMREIVNVFNKQKQVAKEDDNTSQKTSSSLIKPHENKSPTKNAPDSSKRDDDDADCNRIEAATPQTDVAKTAAAIKSKSANAAEKVTPNEKVEEKYKSMLLRLSSRNREKKSSTVVVQSTPSEHQSVNEQTLTKVGVVNKSASNAKIPKKSIDKTDVGKKTDFSNKKNPDNSRNCISATKEQSNCETDYVNNIKNRVDEKDVDKESDAEDGNVAYQGEPHKQKSPSEINKLDIETKSSFATPLCGLEYTTSTYGSLDNLLCNMSSGGGSSTIQAMIQHPSFPAVDLDSLKQQSIFGEIIVSNLRDIDVKLMELHKRKMFIEEMLLKLQKEKMDADLQTIKLQNEKFILLNTAMTANATTATKIEPTVVASVAELKSEGTNTEQTFKSVPKCTSSAKTTQCRKKRLESDDSIKKESAKTNKTNDLKKAVSQLKATGPRVKRKYTKRGESQKTQLAKRKKLLTAAEVISSDDNNDNVIYVDDMYLRTPVRPKTSVEVSTLDTTVDSNDKWNYADVACGHLQGIKSPITQIRIFEYVIVAATEDGSLYKFDARTLQLEKEFVKHSEAITQMFLCREKKVLYTTSLDGYLKKTSIENFELDIQSLYLQEPLQSIDIQWGVAYIGSRWGNIFIYDIVTNNLADTLLCSLEASIIAIKAVKEGPRKVLVVSSKGNMIQFRDASSGLLLRTLDVPEHLHIYSLLLDYGCIYCGTQKNEIYKFDFTTGARMSILNCGNGAVSMRFYKNKFILVGCYDGLIYVLDKETGHCIEQIAGSGKMVLTLEIAGDKIFTSSKDNSMKVIDIPSHVVALTNA